MKLPIPFIGQKKQNTDYYLALILTDEKADAIILQENHGTLKRINSHEEHFSISIEDISKEDFITVIDRTISRAEEILPPDIETHQTVFGVKANWVDQESKKIKKEYLDKLKKVCDALDLTPIGFMVTTEAVIHLLQEEEGAPLSAVFAEVEKSQITLSLYRGGKVVETLSHPHGDSAPATVDRLLGHFTVPVLPARIVLLLNKPDERTQQAFIAHQWSKSLPFLHIPQVMVLPPHYDNRAVIFGAAKQMGFTVLPETSEDMSTPVAPNTNIEDETIVGTSVQEELPALDPIKKDEDEELTEITSPEVTEGEKGGDFGFVINGEASERPKLHQAPQPHTPLHEEAALPPHPEIREPLHNLRPEPELYEEADEEPARTGKKLPILSALQKLRLPENIKFPNIGRLSKNKTVIKIVLPMLAVIILVFGIYSYYVNGVKATVLLTVAPKTVDQEETITFSTSSGSDFSSNVLAAQTITASVEGETSADATGKKDVGEKAKGSITIYNNDSEAANLSANTELKSNNGEIFVLDSSVKVPAASGDIFTGTKPGTVQANVTAKELGTDGNLPSGTRFSVGSNSDLAARNENAFSGGTKKNVTVVSKEDLAKLRTELTKKLQSNAQSALAKEAGSGETVLPFVGNGALQKEKFDKKEGEETKKITLKGTVSFSGMSYQNEELKNFAQTLIKNKYEQDTTVAPDSVNETVKNVTQKNTKTAEATITLQAGLLPKIDTQDVIANIQEKSLANAKETIANLPQVTQTDITFSPPIPLLPNLFPRLPKQLTVEVKTQ